MAGICKYCGFSGTDEMLMNHAGSCPPDEEPDDAYVPRPLHQPGFGCQIVDDGVVCDNSPCPQNLKGVV